MAAMLFASRHGSDLNLPQVQWRDLIAMTRTEKLIEILHPLPWLFASVWLYSRGELFLGAFASFYFFLTGLRLSHGAQHYSIGLSRWAQDLVLFTLSILMLGSMHAVQASHLHHHRHCLTESDAEGATARLPWWRAILVGPLFPIRLHRAAWQLGNQRQRCWIFAELLAIGCVITAGFFLAVPGLTIHVAAMLFGECFTGFFAVWTVHHHCDDAELPARTQRGRWINWVSYNMFFHAEHHLYPAVPTCHLHTLAQRLDQVNSTLSNKQVLAHLNCTRQQLIRILRA